MTRWQKFFAEDPRLVSIPPSQCARESAAHFTRRGIQRVLDIACGAGRDTEFLRSQGLEVIGVDAAFSGLELARARQPGAPPPYAAACAQHLPFAEACFPGIYCFGLLHEFTGPQSHADALRAVAEMRRVLAPGGLAVLSVLAGDPQAGLPHVQLYDEKMFDEICAALTCLEKDCFADTSCTGVPGYRVWRGILTKR